MTDVVWTGEYRAEDGEVGFRVGRAGSELVAEWPGLARLYAAGDGASHRWEFEPEADDASIDKIKQGLGRGLLRHLQGRVSLHASAVSLNGRAIACIGASGMGKSTLAADLCQHHGAALLADDVAAIEIDADPAIVLPGERAHYMVAESLRALGLRFRDDPDVDKHAVTAASLAAGPAPLHALVSLKFDDALAEPRLEPVRGLDALERLVPCLARFVIDDAQAQLRECEQLRSLAARVPLLELRRPRNLLRLNASSSVLLDLFERSMP
jgi:hypothetical protein